MPTLFTPEFVRWLNTKGAPDQPREPSGTAEGGQFAASEGAQQAVEKAREAPKKVAKPKKSKYLKRFLDPKYEHAYDNLSMSDVIKTRGELERSIAQERGAASGGGLRSEVAEANARELQKQLNAVEERYEVLRHKHEAGEMEKSKSYGRPLIDVLSEDDDATPSVFVPQFVQWLRGKNLTDDSGHEHDSGTGRFTNGGGGGNKPPAPEASGKPESKPRPAAESGKQEPPRKAAKKQAMKKVAEGEYEYKGRTIYRTDDTRGAYNPWKIQSSKRSFATLAEARAHIDAAEGRKEDDSGSTPPASP